MRFESRKLKPQRRQTEREREKTTLEATGCGESQTSCELQLQEGKKKKKTKKGKRLTWLGLIWKLGLSHLVTVLKRKWVKSVWTLELTIPFLESLVTIVHRFIQHCCNCPPSINRSTPSSTRSEERVTAVNLIYQWLNKCFLSSASAHQYPVWSWCVLSRTSQ